MSDNSKLDAVDKRLEDIEKRITIIEKDIKAIKSMFVKITPQKERTVSKAQRRALGLPPK